MPAQRQRCFSAVTTDLFLHSPVLKMRTQPVAPTNGNDFSDIELVDRLLRGVPGAASPPSW
jgi:hypothetical protein